MITIKTETERFECDDIEQALAKIKQLKGIIEVDMTDEWITASQAQKIYGVSKQYLEQLRTGVKSRRNGKLYHYEPKLSPEDWKSASPILYNKKALDEVFKK